MPTSLKRVVRDHLEHARPAHPGARGRDRRGRRPFELPPVARGLAVRARLTRVMAESGEDVHKELPDVRFVIKNQDALDHDLALIIMAEVRSGSFAEEASFFGCPYEYHGRPATSDSRAKSIDRGVRRWRGSRVEQGQVDFDSRSSIAGDEIPAISIRLCSPGEQGNRVYSSAVAFACASVDWGHRLMIRPYEGAVCCS